MQLFLALNCQPIKFVCDPPTGLMQTPSLLEAARRRLVVFALVYCVGLSFQKSKRRDKMQLAGRAR